MKFQHDMNVHSLQNVKLNTTIPSTFPNGSVFILGLHYYSRNQPYLKINMDSYGPTKARPSEGTSEHPTTFCA